MIADLKPYPAIKDSGVGWLGEVPEYWEVVPNRALFDEIKDRDCSDEQMLSVTIKKGVIRQAALLEDTSKKDSSNLDRSNYKLVQPGDIAYNKMRAWQGAVGVSDYRGIISPAYVVQRPRAGVDSRYFHHLLRTPAFAKEAERWSYGITSDMWSLRPEHFKIIYACLPSLPEQAAIARFLDFVDRRVRRYVRAKQKLIGLLEEQKQAIIHRAVTRGLDPDVPLKPSDVEWLGDVPEHWEVLAVRRCAKTVKTGGTPAGAVDEHFSTSGFNWYTPGDFKDDLYLRASERQLSEIGKKNVKLFPPNTVMMIGIGATIGKVAISMGHASCNQQINGIVLSNRMDVVYFSLSLRSLREYIVSCGKFTTLPIINQDKTKSLPIPVPPISEQRKIVEYILFQVATIDEAIDRTLREIDLLREYRTRLIADVVTGKIDVREAAANLPDELKISEEAEAQEEAEEIPDMEISEERAAIKIVNKEKSVINNVLAASKRKT